jgi:anaerobic ribonucleoside-triphosphate reductase
MGRHAAAVEGRVAAAAAGGQIESDCDVYIRRFVAITITIPIIIVNHADLDFISASVCAAELL